MRNLWWIVIGTAVGAAVGAVLGMDYAWAGAVIGAAGGVGIHAAMRMRNR